MARTINRLSARFVETAKTGFHADGGNLYLVVTSAGARSWIFRYVLNTRQRDKGGGSARDVPLAKARTWAREMRALLLAGVDPLGQSSEKKMPNFGECADAHIKAKNSEWRNAKHADQWTMTLKEYAAPIRSKLVDQVTTEDILTVLRPIWTKLPETAARLRGRLESVLDAAKAQGYRSGDNPARWRGHLDKLLSKRQKLTRGHHAAMDFRVLPKFVKLLRDRPSTSASALEFTIIAAARSGEVLGARWEEIDLGAKVWTIPAIRMKAGREHRVPLPPRALEILEKVKSDDAAFVFTSDDPKKPLSNMAMSMLLRRMQLPDITVHGFRSTFRDWAGETTNFPREIAEAALAHVVGDRVELAYRRGDALEKRRTLMDVWGLYICGEVAQ